MTIAKAELAALEKVFTAEIYGRLPFQSRAKIYKRMEGYGWVVWGKQKWGIATVEGWYLTHPGRYMYCSHCEPPCICPETKLDPFCPRCSGVSAEGCTK